MYYNVLLSIYLGYTYPHWHTGTVLNNVDVFLIQYSSPIFLQCEFEYGQSKVRILLRNAHWRLDSENIAVDAALPEKQTHVSAVLPNIDHLFGCQGDPARLVVHHLYPDHESFSANVSDAL